MKNKFCRGLLGASFFLAVFAVGSAVVMLLWNALVPAVIGWSAIGFWQAAGFMLLCRLLLGGVGHGRWGACGPFGHKHLSREERRQMRDKFGPMGFEERREYIRSRMFGNCCGKPEDADNGGR